MANKNDKRLAEERQRFDYMNRAYKAGAEFPAEIYSQLSGLGVDVAESVLLTAGYANDGIRMLVVLQPDGCFLSLDICPLDPGESTVEDVTDQFKLPKSKTLQPPWRMENLAREYQQKHGYGLNGEGDGPR